MWGAALAFLPWLSPATAADPTVDIEKAVDAQRAIHLVLFALASDNGNLFPNLPGNANPARQPRAKSAEPCSLP